MKNKDANVLRDLFEMTIIISAIIAAAILLVGCGPVSVGTDDGANGQEGLVGQSGKDGQDGYTSLVDYVRFTGSACPSNAGIIVSAGLDLDRDLILDSSEVTKQTVLCDGSKGQDGETPAANPMDVVAIIDPCGDAAGVQDEVMLKLQNGKVISSFSQNAAGQNTRLSLLENGSFVTTDGSNCEFTLNNGVISNEHY